MRNKDSHLHPLPQSPSESAKTLNAVSVQLSLPFPCFLRSAQYFFIWID